MLTLGWPLLPVSLTAGPFLQVVFMPSWIYELLGFWGLGSAP